MGRSIFMGRDIRMRKKIVIPTLIVLVAQLAALGARAAGTENLGIRVLPTPGKVTVDGKIDDWDLSGGIFCCRNTEREREHYACWIHIMYDADGLHVLARWVDRTPMNNPVRAPGNNGWRGDCLQVRFIMAPATPQERTSHVTAWYARKSKKSMMDITYGRRFNEGVVPRAQEEGARQAFLKHADGKGYDQEIALPWKLLTKDGAPLKAGDKFVATVQPNFSAGFGGRRTVLVLDVVSPNAFVQAGAMHTAHDAWGGALLEAKGNLEPWPVRLAGGLMFTVEMKDGVPVVDWDAPLAGEDITPVIKPPYVERVVRLAVQSQPITGVSITGDTPGRTNYTAVCKPDQQAAIVAPPHVMIDGKRYEFLRWQVDGDDRPDAVLKAEMTMRADRSATAVYEVQQLRLSVQSTPTMGVVITGDNRGVTNYSVLCTSRQQIEVKAPDSVEVDGEQYSFVRWIVNEKERPDGLTRIQITMDTDYTATAVYRARGGPASAEGPAPDGAAEPAVQGVPNAAQAPPVRVGVRRMTFIACAFVLVVALGLVAWLISSGGRRS